MYQVLVFEKGRYKGGMYSALTAKCESPEIAKQLAKITKPKDPDVAICLCRVRPGMDFDGDGAQVIEILAQGGEDGSTQ